MAANDGGGMMGQGEVHVVAAQQNVIADGHARQHELARFLADGNQRQVGGAAADVADQDDVADFDLIAPGLLAGVDPRIKRGLRFLEQGDVLQPDRPGRFHGQLAGHGIEGGRHGQDDVLIFQAMLDDVAGP